MLYIFQKRRKASDLIHDREIDGEGERLYSLLTSDKMILNPEMRWNLRVENDFPIFS